MVCLQLPCMRSEWYSGRGGLGFCFRLTKFVTWNRRRPTSSIYRKPATRCAAPLRLPGGRLVVPGFFQLERRATIRLGLPLLLAGDWSPCPIHKLHRAHRLQRKHRSLHPLGQCFSIPPLWLERLPASRLLLAPDGHTPPCQWCTHHLPRIRVNNGAARPKSLSISSLTTLECGQACTCSLRLGGLIGCSC